MIRVLILLALAGHAFGASRYSAEKALDHGVEVIHLKDEGHNVAVSIVPSVGNRAYELKVHGKNILYFPLPDAASLKNGQPPAFNGIPFLAPWANRIPGGGFWAGGKRFLFNPAAGAVRVDPDGIAMHGLLTVSSAWDVVSVKADAKSAQVTSRLSFWKYPELMANWPFAHEYEMTYRLTDGVLQVSTSVRNLSAEGMPISLGFHPYFTLPGTPRAEWDVHIPARKRVETDAHLVATGELTANRLPDRISLKDHTFDDGFTDLTPEQDGRTVFSVGAGGQKIEVIYGPHYQVAVVYAPPGKDFICFEPMTAITNGINLAHDGKYAALQTLGPNSTWQESFWVRATGF